MRPTHDMLVMLLHRPLRIALRRPDAHQRYLFDALGHTVGEDDPDLVVMDYEDIPECGEDSAPATIIFSRRINPVPESKYTRTFAFPTGYALYFSNDWEASDLGITESSLAPLLTPSPCVQVVFGPAWQSVLAWQEVLGVAHRSTHLACILAHGERCLACAEYRPFQSLREHVGSLLKKQHAKICAGLPKHVEIQRCAGTSSIRVTANTLRVAHDCQMPDASAADISLLFQAGYNVGAGLFGSLAPALFFALCWRDRHPGAVCLQDVAVPLLKLPVVLPGGEHQTTPLLTLVVTDSDADVEAWLAYVRSLQRSHPGAAPVTLVVGHVSHLGRRLPQFKWSQTPVYAVDLREDGILATLRRAQASPVYNTRSLPELYTHLKVVDPDRTPASSYAKRKRLDTARFAIQK